MPQKMRCIVRALALSCACIALLSASGCGEKKEQAEGARPTGGAIAEAAKPFEAAKTGNSEKSIPPNTTADPLLGTWKVVKAEGYYAEQNTGIVWTFEKGDKAFSLSRVKPETMGRQEIPKPTQDDVLKKVEWSWKRFDPDSIELSHRSSGSIASIRHRMNGAQLVLDWNNGSQILFLDKQN
jgi:hypothetical protein